MSCRARKRDRGHPTASGKTAVLQPAGAAPSHQITRSPGCTLFPTKALSQTRCWKRDIASQVGRDIKIHTFDGDTPQSARRAIATPAISLSPIRTCSIPVSCRITPCGSGSSKTCNTWWWTRCIITGACSAAIRQPDAALAADLKFYGANLHLLLGDHRQSRNWPSIFEVPFRLIDKQRRAPGEKHFIFYNPRSSIRNWASASR